MESDRLLGTIQRPGNQIGSRWEERDQRIGAGIFDRFLQSLGRILPPSRVNGMALPTAVERVVGMDVGPLVESDFLLNRRGRWFRGLGGQGSAGYERGEDRSRNDFPIHRSCRRQTAGIHALASVATGTDDRKDRVLVKM
jgi:hypothetical protein